MKASFATFDRLLSVAVSLAAFIALGFLIEARLGPDVAGAPSVIRIKNWKRFIEQADVPLDSGTGGVHIAVFTDFECPFCKRMDSVILALRSRFPDRIRRSVIHYPIESHTHARPAAAAFECARQQGRGSEMQSTLYANQNALGQISWALLAAHSGVRDTFAFSKCLGSDPARAHIAAGLALAMEHQVTGTPTVFVDGWLFKPYTPSSIEAAVTAAVNGRSPKP